ncbi:MAG TPA: GAF domain-containing protein [Burkholderiaceae bacterium]|jgi:GAF domain-containing protein|nr:GAF domain-containing protein [Burkholderiaceae bacterium]
MTPQSAATVLARCIEFDLQLAAESDLNRLLQRACCSAQGLCMARYAAAAAIHERDEVAAAFAACGLPSTLNAAAFAPGRGLLAELLRDGVALRIEVLRAGDSMRLGLPAAHPPVRSFLAVPLASEGRPWGWLYVADKRGPGFSEADEQVALTIAGQVVRCRASGGLRLK